MAEHAKDKAGFQLQLDVLLPALPHVRVTGSHSNPHNVSTAKHFSHVRVTGSHSNRHNVSTAKQFSQLTSEIYVMCQGQCPEVRIYPCDVSRSKP